MKKAASFRHLALAAYILACPALIFYAWLPLGVLDPTNISWLVESDPGTHFLGWLLQHDWGHAYVGWHLFRFDAWHFPIGESVRGAWPNGFNIVFSDSNPLVALPLKLVSPLLPLHFQYTGLWLLFVCYANLIACYVLLRALKLQPVQSATGGLLLALFPPFFAFIVHETLLAHFIIVTALALLFHEGRGAGRAGFAVLGGVAVLVHFYFLPVVLLIAAAKPFFHPLHSDLRGQAMDAAGSILAVMIPTLIVMAVVGYFGHRSAAAGFGLYSMNLNAIFNPLDRSRIFDGLSLGSPLQHEGYQYWGLGWFSIIVTSILVARRRTLGRRQVLVVAFVVLILLVLSVSNRIYWGDRLLVEIPLFQLEGVVGTFRSSGRFFWAAGYTVCALAIARCALSFRPRVFVPLVAVAVVMQLADVRLFVPIDTTRTPLHGEITAMLEKATDPPPFFHLGSSNYESYYKPLLELADLDIPATRLLTARPRQDTQRLTSVTEALRRGGYFLGSIGDCMGFVSTRPAVEYDSYRVVNNCLLTPADALPTHETTFTVPTLESLFASCSEGCTMVVSAKDEASANLAAYSGLVPALESMGSRIVRLGYRQSYLALFRDAELLFEEFGDRPIELERTVYGRRIKARSGGLQYGDECSIRIDGVEHCPNGRGLNILFLRADGSVEPLNLDTHVVPD